MVIPLCTYLLVRRKILRLYKAVATIIPSRFPLYNIAVHQSRDAKSCVSQATNAPVVSTLWLSLLALTSLVRRKILRLYRAVAIEGMVWGTAVQEPFVNLAS